MLGAILACIGIAGLLALAAWARWSERRWMREHPGQCSACGKPSERYLCDKCDEGSWW